MAYWINMKITVEQYDEKVSIETKHDDLTLTDFMELVRKLAHGLGYSSKSVDEWFEEE